MFNPKYKSKSQKYYICIYMLTKKTVQLNPNTIKLCDSLSLSELVNQLGSSRIQSGSVNW